MNFSEAVKALKNGMAAKRPMWNGYVKRTDDVFPAKYNSANKDGYTAGDYVTNLLSIYRCVQSIPAGEEAGRFDPSKWVEVADVPHKIAYVKRNPELSEVVYQGDDFGRGIEYAPVGAALSLDGELMTAMVATDWYTGTEADFAQAKDEASAAYVW